MENIWKTITKEKIIENLYLAALVCYITIVFFQTTMVEITWPEYFESNVKILLILLVALRLFFSVDANVKEGLLIAAVIGIMLIAQSRNEFTNLSMVALLIVGARGISFKKLLRVYLIVEMVLLIFTVVSALAGYTENLIFYQTGRRPRMAFGIGYPTDFSAYIFFLLLVYYYLRGKFVKYWEFIIGVLAAVFVYWFCDARLNTICIVVTVLVFFFLKLDRKRKETKGRGLMDYGIFTGLLAMAPVLCGGFMILATMLYSPDGRIFNLMDRILNNRLSQGFKGIDIYGFSAWGQQIPMQGNGGNVEIPERYFFLDSSYLSIVLQYGMFVLAVVLLMWICISFSARNRKNWELLWVVAIISVQCMVEHHMLEIAYNPFLWALLADVGDGNKKEMKSS